MAHQVNVHSVKQAFQAQGPGEQVEDPVCGVKMDRRQSRNMLFRGERTHYFCSRACEQAFLEGQAGRRLPKAG